KNIGLCVQFICVEGLIRLTRFPEGSKIQPVQLVQYLITGPFSRSKATLRVPVELFIFIPPRMVPWQPSPMTKVTNFSSVPTRSYIFLAYRTCHIPFCAPPETIAYAGKS
ncbi:unnamed protein product, partial [Prunus brigantina]